MSNLSVARWLSILLLLTPLINAAITLKLESHPRYDAKAAGQSPGMHERSVSQPQKLVSYSLSGIAARQTASEALVPVHGRHEDRGRSRPKRQDRLISAVIQAASQAQKGSGTSIAPANTAKSGSSSPQPTSAQSSQDAQTSHPADLAGTTAVSGGSPTENNPSSTTDERVSLPLNSEDSGGAAFTVHIEVAGKTMRILTDTGSSQFWVASQDCSSCTSAGMEVAPLSTSPGCEPLTQYYGGGWVTGCAAEADIRIGEYTISGQPLLGVAGVDETMAGHSGFMSGILGLGMADGNLVEGDPPLVTLFNEHLLKTPTVGFYLDRDWKNDNTSLGNAEEAGEVTLGDVTESPHVNPSTGVTLQRATLESDGPDHGWQIVDMLAFKVGSAEVSGSGRALIDTGATLMYIPERLLEETYARFGNGSVFKYGSVYAMKCQREEGMPDLYLTIGGRDWRVAYEDLVWYALEGDSGLCAGRISGLAADSVYQYQLGGPFLKNVYTSFNVVDGSVTFYELAG